MLAPAELPRTLAGLREEHHQLSRRANELRQWLYYESGEHMPTLAHGFRLQLDSFEARLLRLSAAMERAEREEAELWTVVR